jgi:outer membrane autotransporter protein
MEREAMKRTFVKNKTILTLTVLLSLYSGTAAAIDLGRVYVNGTRRTIQGNGTIIFSSEDGSRGAVYADNGGTVSVGSTDTTTTYENITANGEVLADNSSKVNLYADTITLDRSDSDAAVTASDESTIHIGDAAITSSITTTGEVLATADEDGSASTVTLMADDITMNYSPNPSRETDYGGGEDHTLYADGGSDITVTATGTVDIEGPIGAVDSGSSITIDGSTISITHNTVGTGNYELETRGIHVEDGASIQIGSDDTDTLNIEVVNGSSQSVGEVKSSIQVKGSDSSLAVYGKTISVTTEDGTFNGRQNEFSGGSLVIGSDATENVTVSGAVASYAAYSDAWTSTIINASKNIDLDSVSGDYNSSTQIGNTDTENVNLYGTLWMWGGAEATILGKNISFEDDTSILFSGPVAQVGSSISIGSDETETVNIADRAEADDYSDITILGNDITIDSVITQKQGQIVVGDASTDSATIEEEIYAQGSDGADRDSSISITADEITAKNLIVASGPNSSITLDGENISLTDTDLSDYYASVDTYAAYGGDITLGSSRTDTLYVAGGAAAVHYTHDLMQGLNEEYQAGSTLTLDATSITVGNSGVTAYGENTNAIIGSAGITETLNSNLTASEMGVVEATVSRAYTGNASATIVEWDESEEPIGGTLTLTAGSATGNLTSSGTGSTLTATLSGALTGNATAEDSGTLTLTADSVTGNLSTSDSGTLTATVSSTFTGMTTDDADTMTLNLNSGATWNLTDSSTVSTLNADGANINLLDGTLGQTLTTDSFAGSGATVYLDADGLTNTGNDHVYVTGTHTGTTALHLSSTSNTWSGALGTVLASVGDEQGSFVSDGETEAALYYYNLILASTTDNVTDGYNTDWYLEGFTKEATDNEGHHTTVVRNLGGITGSNYLLWRSDMDTLFRRLGETDNSLTENTDDGIWIRAKGKKFSRVSDFLVDTKYNEYEAGYDWLHDKTDKNEHVAGVGIAYLDGDSTYVSGKGDLTGYTLSLYDTTVWKDGQYLDLVLKGSRYKNEFSYRALGRYIDGKSDSTGLSLGAEYGYKRKTKSGWYVEPQAQFVLGYFRNNDFTDSNGVHVDNETIRTAIGRIGMRAGYEDKKLSAYAKANWYHDFGGNHVTTMSVGTDSLRVHEDYGDTWFAYGLGAAYKVNDTAQLYFDLERGDGSTYDENWSWDVGLRFSF